MSVGYQIAVEGEAETKQRLEKLYAETLPLSLHEDIAKAAAAEVKEHLEALDGSRANKLGGRRSHFYHHAAESVVGEATTEGAVVVIDQLGLRQRWLGGDIYPVNAKYLAIPARAESYGISPRDFPGDLLFIRFRSGAMALVKDEQSQTVDDYGNFRSRSAARGERRTRSRTVGLVEYWLKDHVYQEPDPSVLPSKERLTEVALQTVKEYLIANE